MQNCESCATGVPFCTVEYGRGIVLSCMSHTSFFVYEPKHVHQPLATFHIQNGGDMVEQPVLSQARAGIE